MDQGEKTNRIRWRRISGWRAGGYESERKWRKSIGREDGETLKGSQTRRKEGRKGGEIKPLTLVAVCVVS